MALPKRISTIRHARKNNTRYGKSDVDLVSGGSEADAVLHRVAVHSFSLMTRWFCVSAMLLRRRLTATCMSTVVSWGSSSRLCRASAVNRFYGGLLSRLRRVEQCLPIDRTLLSIVRVFQASFRLYFSRAVIWLTSHRQGLLHTTNPSTVVHRCPPSQSSTAGSRDRYLDKTLADRITGGQGVRSYRNMGPTRPETLQPSAWGLQSLQYRLQHTIMYVATSTAHPRFAQPCT
jgi:hypothetical protein